jgi:uncharacterized protein YjbJ (UPF0337 family)
MKNNPSTNIKSGTQDEVEGSVKTLTGKVKEGIGRAVGNPRLEAEGNSDQLKGNVQKKVGQIKKVFDQ